MKKSILIGCSLLTLSLSAQWHSLKGPFGGGIDNYANVENSSYVSTSNGLYRSDDNGNAWIRLDNNLPEFMEAIGFCVDQDEVFYNYRDPATNQYGFVYSADKGTHWKPLPLPEPNWNSFSMTYRNGLLIANIDNGLIESMDKGLSWNFSSLNGRVNYVTSIESNHSFYFITDFSRVYRRSISDTTWNLIFDTPDDFYTFHVSDSLLLIVMDRKPGFRSLDNGLSWNQHNLTGYNSDQKIAEFGDTLYYTDSEKLYRSTDKGSVWEPIKSMITLGAYIGDLLRIGNSLMAIQDYYGLLKTEDEFDTYHPSTNGIYSQSCNRMIATDSFLFVLGQVSLGRYNLANKQWNTNPFFFDDYVEDFCYYKGLLYVISTYSDNIYISKDQGNSFELKKFDSFLLPHETKPKIFAFKDKIMVFEDGVLVISEDFGETWKLIEIKDWITNYKINYSDITVFNDKLILVSDELSADHKLYSTSDPNVWNDAQSIVFPGSDPNSHYFYLYASSKFVFIARQTSSDCYLYRLDSQAVNLIKCEGISDLCNLPFDSRNKLIETKNKLIFITENGYYFSEDEGLHWNRVVDEFYLQSGSRFNDMVCIEDKLYASCYNIGVVETGEDSVKTGMIRGMLYLDENKNALFDGNDRPLTPAFVELKRTTEFIPTDHNGIFNVIYASSLTDTLIPVYYSKYGSFLPDKRTFLPGDTALNFAYSIPGQIEDLSIGMVQLTRARPGFHYYLEMNIRNQGAQACSAQLTLEMNQGFSFEKASIDPQVVTSNALSWDLSNLDPLDEKHIRVEFLVSDTMKLFTKFNLRAELQNLSCNDIDLSDNVIAIEDEFRGSCDPNEITVDKDQISKNDLNNNASLTYTIRFQNTGNHEAEFVKLKNYLSNFDLSSLVIKASSHPYTYKITDSNLFEVDFDMIHLADSLSDEFNSHGYFTYSISPIPKDVYRDTITNSSYIEFDYNADIQTNTAITKVVDLVKNHNLSDQRSENITIVPNPTNGEFLIFSPEFSGSKLERIQIYNLDGVCIFDKLDRIQNGYIIQADDLNPGIYILKIGISNQWLGKICIQK